MLVIVVINLFLFLISLLCNNTQIYSEVIFRTPPPQFKDFILIRPHTITLSKIKLNKRSDRNLRPHKEKKKILFYTNEENIRKHFKNSLQFTDNIETEAVEIITCTLNLNTNIKSP